MIFVPLPRFVFPTFAPFFRRSETTVDEGFLYAQNTTDPQFEGKSFQISFITPERTHC